MNITIISSNILYVTHQMSLKKKKDPVGGTVSYKMMNYKVIPGGIGGTAGDNGGPGGDAGRTAGIMCGTNCDQPN